VPLRPRTALTLALALTPAVHVHVHIHHHFHGLAGGYIGLAAAALTSWIGLVGPGEAALVTGGVVAAHGRLDILEVVLIAWLGGVVGGNIGWALGLRGGRALVTRRGPLYRSRLRTLARGERFYERYGMVAVFFTPAWMAGIAEMRWARFFPANMLAALAWAAGFGVGAYFAGPPILEVADDFGLVGTLIVVGLIGGALTAEALRRRRVQQRSSP
jgi:membrane protein DedA with SNARE-associated domain